VESREGLERDRQRHGEVLWTDAVFAQPETQPHGPTPQIPVDLVLLLLKRAVAGLELVDASERPVLVQFGVEPAEDQVVAGAV